MNRQGRKGSHLKSSSRREEDNTADTPFCGRVKVFQPPKGFRYSIDAYLLVDFAAGFLEGKKPRSVRVIELGSGSGVVSLGMALHPAVGHVTGVEIVGELVRLGRRSAEASGMTDKVSFVQGDLKELSGAGIRPKSFEIVVTNPPYRPVAGGRVSPDFARAVARHEVACTLADVVKAAAWAMKEKGRLCMIYPPERLSELMAKLDDNGLRAGYVRFVHPGATEPARMMLVEAHKTGAASTEVMPPLIVHDEDGDYSAEVKRTFEGPR